jgi:hypothetical protein
LKEHPVRLFFRQVWLMIVAAYGPPVASGAAYERLLMRDFVSDRDFVNPTERRTTL